MPSKSNSLGVEMKYEDFLSKISFRYIKPDSPIPWKYQEFSDFFENVFNIQIELFNTQFPCKDHEIKDELRKLIKVPKMSTLTIGAIINFGVKQIPQNQTFVNVGIWNGFTFLAGMLNNPEKICIGIDNFSQFGGPRQQFLERFNKMKSQNHFFMNMDYEKYFSDIHSKEIGFYIYDGEHSYKNQLNGLLKADPFLAENALILIDDINWEEPYQATLDFISQGPSEYSIIFDCKTYCSCHPTFWNGIMVLRKNRNK